MAGSCGCGECKDCKRVREHVASLLPIRVLEAVVNKPLRISGVAMAAGMSRNFNVYTPEELQAFASRLIGAPIYMEHVTANDAVGKTTKSFFDAASRCLMYEAEIYDLVVADKIRNGLIQHVSVGADYDAIDVVNAKVPHGLYNAEMSLVAVPGIPETNIQVLEHLRESLAHNGQGKVRLKAKELLSALSSSDLACVFCGKHGEYIVSTCTACGDNAQSAVVQAATEFFAGFDPAKGAGDFSALVVVERVGGHVVFKSSGNGVEKVLEEKDLESLAAKVAEKLKAKEAVMLKCPKCGMEFDAAQWEANGWKCPNSACGVEVVPPAPVALAVKGEPSAAEKLVELEGRVKAAGGGTDVFERLKVVELSIQIQNALLEKYRKVAPGVELLVDPPVLMPVSEAAKLVKETLPASMIQRSWSLGPQRLCQDLNRLVQTLEHRAGGA
jgi:hypothetical protein